MTNPNEISSSLSRSWDAGDSVGWSECFAADADFVDVLGRRQKGRATIEREHRKLFDSIYAGSTCAFRVIADRPLGDGIRLIHTASRIAAPSGPREGDTFATQTMIVRDGLVEAFHNSVQRTLDQFTGEHDDPGSPTVSREPRDPTI